MSEPWMPSRFATPAWLVAGTSGSRLFSLAFQQRLRSVFILAWSEFLQLSEALVCAGHKVDLYYHLGSRPPDGSDKSWVVDIARLEEDVVRWLKLSAMD